MDIKCAALLFVSCGGAVVFYSLTFIPKYQYWNINDNFNTTGSSSVEGDTSNINTTLPSLKYDSKKIITDRLIIFTRYIGWLLGIAAFLMMMFVLCFVQRINGTKRLQSLKRVTIFVLFLCACCSCMEVYLYTETRGLIWTYLSVLCTVFTIPLVYSYGLTKTYTTKEDEEKLI